MYFMEVGSLSLASNPVLQSKKWKSIDHSIFRGCLILHYIMCPIYHSMIILTFQNCMWMFLNYINLNNMRMHLPSKIVLSPSDDPIFLVYFSFFHSRWLSIKTRKLSLLLYFLHLTKKLKQHKLHKLLCCPRNEF